jgi:predicted ArsR family transcriptional regulator
MAVRRHLTLLEGDGLVFSHQEKKARGRPVSQYYLTEAGHESFQRDYANLGIELLTSIRSLEGQPKVHEIFEQRKRQYLQQYRGRISGKTLESRVHQVSQLLTENGYMAAWEKLAPTRYVIRLMNCAVEQVARKFPHLCIYEEKFISELLQAKVTRECHILQSDHSCTYLIEGSKQSRSQT